MNELKYCKFCDKEKPIKEFCKSGSFVKNICKECQNKKQKQIYANAKKVNEKDVIINNLQSKIDKAIEYINKLENFKIKYVMLEEKELYASEKDFVKELSNILKEDK